MTDLVCRQCDSRITDVNSEAHRKKFQDNRYAFRQNQRKTRHDFNEQF